MTTTQTRLAPIPRPAEGEFQTGSVLTIVVGHITHDLYPAFLSTALPVIIEKLSISLAMAGLLTGFAQMPGLITPFIGHLADRMNLRAFVILAPALTATFFSLIGAAPNYATLAIILLIGGISSAAYHAPAPAMVGHVSGRQMGKGLSFFMAGGELGRTLGPMVIAWGVSLWTLEGTWRLMFLGWAASAVLYWQLHRVSAQTPKRGTLSAVWPHLRRLILPLAWMVFFRDFVIAALVTFLPTYMDQRGASLFMSGAALSIWQGAGVIGALASGTLSDRYGRKPMLVVTSIAAAIMLIIFPSVSGWVTVPVLVLSGLTAMATAPVVQAMLQEQMPSNRALANGLYVMLVFVARPLIALIIGAVGDSLSLSTAFLGSAVVSLLALPAILLLPEREMPD